MLHENAVPSIWMDVKFTCNLCSSSYSILLGQLLYCSICCQVFLTEFQKNPAALLSPSHPLSPHSAEWQCRYYSHREVLQKSVLQLFILSSFSTTKCSFCLPIKIDGTLHRHYEIYIYIYLYKSLYLQEFKIYLPTDQRWPLCQRRLLCNRKDGSAA